MYRNRQDEYDHYDAIKVFSKIANAEPTLRSRLGVAGPAEIGDRLKELMDQRHLADYYPYGTSEPHIPPLDFIAVAPSVAQRAADFVGTVGAFIEDKRGGRI